ncbi:MAG TPA: hypothetical protein VN828_20615 [Acidobacteriaceae bacterium]|nr:hypothetical protein [Acidobacteriaceae bacterium]
MANKTRKASAGKTPTRAAHAHTPPASSSNLVDDNWSAIDQCAT